MSGVPRRSVARIVLAALVATALVAGRVALPGAEVSALSRWTGGIDLYRTGVFTTQKTWLWCTAADVQIIRNIADHQTDHSRTTQRRYFDYMRAHDRYAIPVTDGTDPGGWTAGLQHFVDSRYRLVQSTSFSAALRSAVTNLRKTNLPVALAVWHGNHGWVMTGFTATADPARTSSFTVTSVRVVGPLWGLRNRTYGYDMRPDTKLTPSQLRTFFTPWHYARVRMAWEGRWVSIQPVATTTTSAVTTLAPGAAAHTTTGAAPTAPEAAAQSGVYPRDEARISQAANDMPAATVTGSSSDLPGSATTTGASTSSQATSRADDRVARAETPLGRAAPQGSTPAASATSTRAPGADSLGIALTGLLASMAVVGGIVGRNRSRRAVGSP